MPHFTLRVLRAEHQALRMMLRSMQDHLAQSRRANRLPDFQMLRNMLLYLDEFPQQRHHKKESDLLFPKIRARTLDARDFLDRLDADHAEGEYAIRRLEHALLAYEVMGVGRRDAFEVALRRYADFYQEHMHLEEAEVMPLAQSVLTASDWDDLDEAFGQNHDPLADSDPDEDYRALFQHIASQAAGL